MQYWKLYMCVISITNFCLIKKHLLFGAHKKS